MKRHIEETIDIDNKLDMMTTTGAGQRREITYEDIESYSFSSNQDVIGYDWKDFDFDSGFYLIYAEKNYIIKNGLDQYFKIHFIDFYDDLGEKGHPTFEILQL